MNHGQIKKLHVDTGFTIISNTIARDKNLSAKEKGIMLCLLSLPDDWRIYKTQLHQFFSDGRDSIINGFNSLIEKGYIQTERVHEPSNGQFVGYNYLVSPIPGNTETVPIPGNPIPAEPFTDNPKTENTELQKKDSTNKKITKKKNADLDFDLSRVVLPFNEPLFITAWNAWVTYRQKEKKKLSVIAATAQLKLLSKYNYLDAIDIIETSMRNQWQGIFELKSNGYGKQKNGNHHGGTADQFRDRYEKYKQMD